MNSIVSYIEGSIGHLVMNQAKSKNAMTMEMRLELLVALEEQKANPAVRAIVLSGAGQTFCAGGDIKTMAGVTGADMRNRLQSAERLIRAISEGDTPIIAAVEGWALGAGLSLAAACDVIVAARDAKFGAVFAKIGLGADFGLSWTLPRRVAVGRARLMVMSGRIIDAQVAADWGMVDELAEPGQAISVATRLAEDISAMAPLAVSSLKRGFARSFASLENAMEYEAATQAALVETVDFSEGIASFTERRAASFAGR